MYAYLRSVWGCRYFWLSLVKNDLRSRYRGSFFGMGWSLLQPILMTTILCVVFSTIFHHPDPLAFATMLLGGLTLWVFVGAVTQGGTHCFFQGESYIRQYPAPMAIYPLRTVLGGAFHLLIGMVPVLALCAWKNGHLTGPLTLLSLVPTLALILTTGWAVATLMGILGVHFRDTKHLSEVALQGLFYLSPIMYPEELIRGRRTLGRLLEVNPVVPFLRLMRDALVDDRVPAASTYLAAALIAGSLALVAVVTLRFQERRLIFSL